MSGDVSEWLCTCLVMYLSGCVHVWWCIHVAVQACGERRWLPKSVHCWVDRNRGAWCGHTNQGQSPFFCTSGLLFLLLFLHEQIMSFTLVSLLKYITDSLTSFRCFFHEDFQKILGHDLCLCQQTLPQEFAWQCTTLICSLCQIKLQKKWIDRTVKAMQHG